MKRKWTMMLVSSLCAVSLLPVIGCSDDKTAQAAEAEAYVSVDINPSVEFITDGDGIVLTVRATNEDASILLSDIDLSGKSIKEAVKWVTKESEILGYLNNKNKDVSIIAASDEQVVEDKVENLAEEGVQEGSDKAELKADANAISLAEEVAAYKAADPELYKNLTVAKLKLAKSIMEFDSTFTVERAANIRTNELVHMLHEYTEEYKHMQMESLKAQFEEEIAKRSEAIYAQIDALYGEEYATLNALIRKLDGLEEKFEDELERIEDELEWEAKKNGLEEPDFDDELMNEEMKAQLTEILGVHTMVDLDELEDYIEVLERQAYYLKKMVVLTEEQVAQIASLHEELHEIRKSVCEELKGAFEQVREEYKDKKERRKEGWKD